MFSDVIKKHFHFIGLSLVLLVLIVIHRNDMLFWDTVQFAGKHPYWFYENGLFSALPNNLDSGHPPVFGIYIAGLWKIFGKSLVVTHFAMLPFGILTLWYACQIARLYMPTQSWLYPIALLLCPYYLGHSILVSPDIILVAALMMGLYSILSYKLGQLIIASVLLSMISMRGFMVLSCLALWQAVGLWQNGDRVKHVFMRIFKIYFPAVALFFFYQAWHKLTSDWVGFHADSPWSDSFAKVSAKGILRNVIVYTWRLLDHGMFVPVLLALWGLKSITVKSKKLWLLLILFLGMFFLVLIPFNGLLNHRYFLPILIVVLLLSCLTISSFEGLKKTIASAVLLISMLGGNFMVYPDTLSQGWDCTAAHWPIYNMEKQMHAFIDMDPAIKISEVGTAFPMRVPRQYLYLNDETTGYHQYDLQKDNYILRSNIMNEFSDEEIATLDAEWKVIKVFKKLGIHLTLYERSE